MANHPPDQQQYWDANLDPANLDAHVRDAAAALQREVDFALRTPDITQMLDHLTTNASHTAPRRYPLIADIGAGLGTTATLLQRRGMAVVALDISHNRLATLRQATAQLSTGENYPPIYVVKCRAEALPFRDGTLDGACTRAVLIHTNIPAACAEINRALQPGAAVAFAEVMARNPFANLYRNTLAPKEWQSITTYFTSRESATVSSAFSQPTVRPHYVLAFLAFAFQYAVPSPRLFSLTLNILSAIDRLLGKIAPGFWRYAWFALITGKAHQS